MIKSIQRASLQLGITHTTTGVFFFNILLLNKFIKRILALLGFCKALVEIFARKMFILLRRFLARPDAKTIVAGHQLAAEVWFELP